MDTWRNDDKTYKKSKDKPTLKASALASISNSVVRDSEGAVLPGML